MSCKRREASCDIIKQNDASSCRQKRLLENLRTDLKSSLEEKTQTLEDIGRLRREIERQTAAINQFERGNAHIREMIKRMDERIDEESTKSLKTLQDTRSTVKDLKLEIGETLDRDAEIHYLKAKLDSYSIDEETNRSSSPLEIEIGQLKRCRKYRIHESEIEELMKDTSPKKNQLRHSVGDLPSTENKII